MDTTFKEFLACNKDGNPYFDEEKISPDNPLTDDIFVWNNSIYLFFLKDCFKHLPLTVGYAKERDTAIMEEK